MRVEVYVPGVYCFFRFFDGAVFFSPVPNIKIKQDDDKERKCRKNGGINNFFHVKNNDFCSGTHRVTSRLSGCRFTAIRFFYKCMFGKWKNMHVICVTKEERYCKIFVLYRR